MKLEVLMSVMHQKDLKIVEEANIRTDAVLINQTNDNFYQEQSKDNLTHRMYSYNERGIGKSRNRALLSSNSDICLIADDDVVYNADYEHTILNAFEKNPSADVIIFDLFILEKAGYRPYRNKNKKINKLNFMKHGGPKIAFKRESVIRKNIFFSLLFGGGAKYGSGEDSLFLKQCLDAGLKVFEVSQNIGEVDNRQSTWFTGYDEKFFKDKGALFKALFPRVWFIMIVQFIVRHSKKFGNLSFITALKWMLDGARNF